MSEPRISVIIVSYNRADDLRMCLDSVFSSGYQNLQVIVVDNASKDSSAAVAATYDAVVLLKCDTNLGFAEGNNVGLRAANGEYIALLNNDLVLEKTWFHTLVHFLESHPTYGAAGGRAYCWDAQNPPFGMSNDYYSIIEIEADTGRAHYRRNNDDPANDVAGLVGCAVLIRREALNSAGPVFLERPVFCLLRRTGFLPEILFELDGNCATFRKPPYGTGAGRASRRTTFSTITCNEIFSFILREIFHGEHSNVRCGNSGKSSFVRSCPLHGASFDLAVSNGRPCGTSGGGAGRI